MNVRRLSRGLSALLALSSANACFSSSSTPTPVDAGLDSETVADATIDQTEPETAAPDSPAPEAGPADAPGDSADGGVDAPVDAPPDAIVDATLEGAPEAGVEAGGGGTDLTWAQWPIPNSPSDVEAGAPNPQSYTNNADGTVTDNVTGLMWQATPTGPDGGTYPELALASAPGYCTGLSLAGHADWRLPTVTELASLLDYNATPPLIDVTQFPGTPQNWFWTATPLAGGTGTPWTVHFGIGYTGRTTLPNDPYPVRCVRGGTGPFASTPGPAPAGRYTTMGTGAATSVYDTKTHLTWQQVSADGGTLPPMTPSDALAYCAGITLNGQPARLPTANELMSLVDFSQTGSSVANLDLTVFPGTPAYDFWSSTEYNNSANEYWAVLFNGGGANPDYSTNPYDFVRCVR
jgi:hypothetical protein